MPHAWETPPDLLAPGCVRRTEAHAPYDRHLEMGTVVLPELRVLYVPVPKAGWTSLLWLLAGPAGLAPEDFARSVKPEVTPAMAVHDMKVWHARGYVLAALDPQARAEALTGEGWFRFTVVRDPAARLWSAWQSKVLLREPYYRERFGDQPWFPRVPESPADVVEDFRAFVAAVSARAWADDVTDKHWAPQHLLVERLPVDHVGHVTRLDETVDALRAHLGGRADALGSLTRDNRALLPYDPCVYGAAGTDTLGSLFAEDYARFGYAPTGDAETAAPDRTDPSAPGDPGPAGARAAWEARVADRLDVVREVAARHERLTAYHRETTRRRGELRRRLDAERARTTALRRQRDAARARARRAEGTRLSPLRRLVRRSPLRRLARRTPVRAVARRLRGGTRG
jgi:hypothetical protein